MKDNTLQASTQMINCKRQIVIKSVVTNDFKVDLAIELQSAIDNLNNQIMQIGEIIKLQKEKGYDVTQIDGEQKKMIVKMKVIQDRLKELKSSKEGSLFTTGTIEGYSQLRVGDDIREKLDYVEVIAKNYIIQEIKPMSKEKNTDKPKAQITQTVKI